MNRTVVTSVVLIGSIALLFGGLELMVGSWSDHQGPRTLVGQNSDTLMMLNLSYNDDYRINGSFVGVTYKGEAMYGPATGSASGDMVTVTLTSEVTGKSETLTGRKQPDGGITLTVPDQDGHTEELVMKASTQGEYNNEVDSWRQDVVPNDQGV